MQNLLTPKGLHPHHKQPIPPIQMHQVPRFDQDLMPSKPMGWIMDGDGPHQLLLEETARGLGQKILWCSFQCPHFKLAS